MIVKLSKVLIIGFSLSGYAAGSLSLKQDPFTYSSAYTDSESGQQYLNARYYNPRLMHFVTRDSYALMDRYGYGNANPIMNDDPSGHVSMSWQAGVGMGIGGLSGVIAGFFTAGVGSFVAVAITEAVIGGASSAITDGVTYALGGKMSWKQAGLDVGLGGVTGLVAPVLGISGRVVKNAINDTSGILAGVGDDVGGNAAERNIVNIRSDAETEALGRNFFYNSDGTRNSERINLIRKANRESVSLDQYRRFYDSRGASGITSKDITIEARSAYRSLKESMAEAGENIRQSSLESENTYVSNYVRGQVPKIPQVNKVMGELYKANVAPDQLGDLIWFVRSKTL